MEAATSLFETSAPSQAEKTSPKTRFYTYLVTPVGPVIQVTDSEGQESLSLRAKLTRNDGQHRVMPMRIANNERSPALVERATELFAKRVPVRMVVEIKRTVIGSKMIPEAVAESILEPKRAAPVAQMNLF